MASMKDYIDCVPLKTKHRVVQLGKPKLVPRVRRDAVSDHIDTVSRFDDFVRGKFDVNCGLNRKLLRNFQVQRRIDLHGYTQNEAFNVLRNFLAKCQLDGIKNVLVVTGGNALKVSVLRTSFRKWIKENFSTFVSSYSFANLKDGGQGAFYVVIRKKFTPLPLSDYCIK